MDCGGVRPAEAATGIRSVKTLQYRLQARSRVSAGRAPEVLNSRDIQVVLPGSTVRGAIATAWLRDKNLAAPGGSTEFESLFEERLTVRPAIPEGFELLAMSWVRCKYPATENCRTEWHDQAAGVLAGTTPLPGCPGCPAGLEHGRGWAPDSREVLASAAGTRTISTSRTALEDDGTAKAEQLFTRRAVEKGTRYVGELLLTDPNQDDLDWLCEERSLRVGGQRSVLGHVTWIAEHAEIAGLEPVPERIVLRLASPAILVDDYGAASLDLELELQQVFGEAVGVERSWIRPQRIAGWHMASGLGKPEDWALEAGSTFVVSGLPENARELLRPGLGQRRREGFGQVSLLTADELKPAAGSLDVLGESAAPHEDAARVIDRLIATCPDEAVAQVVRALIDGVGRVRQAYDHGSPESEIDQLRRDTLAHPWSRRLPAETMDAADQLLRSRGLRRVESLLRGRGMNWGDS